MQQSERMKQGRVIGIGFAKVASVGNLLSASRAVAGLALVAAPSGAARAVLIAWGALSDFLDGFAARRLGNATAFGAGLDLVCDGVFFIGALAAFWRAGLLPTVWLITIVLAGGGLQGLAQGILVLRHRPIGSTGHRLSKALGGAAYLFVLGLAAGAPVGYLAPVFVGFQLAANGRDVVAVLRSANAGTPKN
jgi:phosphatidylglycerophosphate synthase